MREVQASAPGKINLTLRVGAPTPDGYHPLVSVFEALSVREYVTVRTSKSPGIHVDTTAYAPDGTIDEATTALMGDLDPSTHLAVRAARALQRLAAAGPWAATASGISIRVDKHVPVAGGMAGGSADAAAALLACNELWELGLSLDQLCQIGRTLGADVPACLVGGIALGEGRGDRMRPLTSGVADSAAVKPASHYWALALAHGGLSTPEVFREFDRASTPTPLVSPRASEEEIFTSDPRTLSGALVNDLQEAALRLRPELADTMRAAADAGALAVTLCGSGPTIAALGENDEHARELAAALAPLPTVARTLISSGPAQGARIEGKTLK